ncbi:hypothetical protein N0V88_001450 [Collariella sp. IMI 366227]|nr:hypothetical protein N0V88_001450 [Collariella sp. IMI 366227]
MFRQFLSKPRDTSDYSVANNLPEAPVQENHDGNTFGNGQPQEQVQDNDNGNTLEAGTPSATNDDDFVTGGRLVALVVALSITVFLMFLDTSIIATAIPRISDEFHFIQDVGWYMSIYQLTNAVFQPLAGKIYQLFNVRFWFVVFLVIFEIGSLVCGTAQSSAVLIGGRAIAGIGAAGLTSGALTIVAYAAPLNKRPSLTAFVMGLGQVGLALGPVVGGAFTSYMDWRWCFLVNIPIGVFACGLLLPIRVPGQASKPTPSMLFRKLHWELDLPGFILLSCAAALLLIAVQFGGVEMPWDSNIIIISFVGAGLIFILWLFWNRTMQNQALIPTTILKSPLFGAAFTQLSLLTIIFYASFFLPLYFQATRGVSPIQSGIYVLPSILAQIITLLIVGRVVELVGRVAPFAILAAAIGAGSNMLYYNLDVDTPTAKLVAFQIFNGFGRGLGMPIPVLAAQAAVQPSEIPLAVSFVTFVSSLGTAIALSVAGNVFNRSLVHALGEMGMGLSKMRFVLEAGATGFRDVVDEDEVLAVAIAYLRGIRKVFLLTFFFAVVGVFMAILMRDIDVRKRTAAVVREEEDGISLEPVTRGKEPPAAASGLT